MPVDLGILSPPFESTNLDQTNLELATPAESLAPTETTVQPVSEETIAEELRVLMQAAFEACSLGCECHGLVIQSSNERYSALRTIRDMSLPCSFDFTVHSYRRDMRKYSETVEEAGRKLPLLSDRLRSSAVTMKQQVLALRGYFTELPKRCSKESPKLAAVRRLASLLLTNCEKLRDFEKEANDYQTRLHSEKSELKAAPPRAKFDPALRKLSEALDRAADIHEKTAAAHILAEQSIGLVERMRRDKFSEPKKPTVEEVARYIQEIEVWCRSYLPTQRAAAENLLSFRRHLAGLNEAIRLLSPLARRVRYLQRRAVPCDVETLVVSAEKIVDWLKKAARQWGTDVEKWQLLELDSSDPVADIAVDEPSFMEELRERIKNVGIGVANKCLAHAAWEQIRREKPQEEPLKNPEFSFGEDFAKLFATASDFARRNEEIAAARERHEAKVQVAWEAYEARKEAARKASGDCFRRASVLEKALSYKHPLSDELRVVLIMSKKLRDIHGLFFVPVHDSGSSSDSRSSRDYWDDY